MLLLGYVHTVAFYCIFFLDRHPTDRPKRGNPMPTYEFYCDKCKKAFSLVMSMSDHAKRKARCPKCKGKKLTQQITAFTAITSSKS